MRYIQRTHSIILAGVLTILAFTLFTSMSKSEQTSDVVRVACVGNSITYGFLLPDPSTDSYPSRLSEKLGSGYTVGNFGRNRATLLKSGHFPYVEREEFQSALQFNPDIIVVHLGVNDTDPNDFPYYGDRFVEDYISLIDTFKNINPNVRVIIANISPLLSKHPRFRSGTRAWRDSIRSLIPTVAEITNSELIDFGELLRDRPELIHDAIHPDKTGAEMMADYVASAITGNFGALKLPGIYGDRMILQRYRPLTISGMSNAHDTISVSIGKNHRTTVASNTGKWNVTLPPMKEATGLTMTIISPTDTINFNDVAVGEVWVASGQSNMEYKLDETPTYKNDSVMFQNSLIRFYDMKPLKQSFPGKWSEDIKNKVDNLEFFEEAQWEYSSPQLARDWSAIAWYFADMLSDSLKVPIGIISNSYGGAPIESWIDIETLEHTIPEILIDWTTNDYVMPWVQNRAIENIASSDDKHINHRHPYEPSYLFTTGIRPLNAYPIAGTIWYQGESNAHNIEIHEQLFPALVDSWRNFWHQPKMPFLFVQLSSLDRPSWPAFRNSQRLLSRKIPNTAMVVSSDKGDSLDVHPRDKKTIGQRLALQALNKVYGNTSIVPEGPSIIKAETIGPYEIKLTFEGGPISTSDGKSPSTIEVAEYDGLYVPVDSSYILSDNEIIAYSMKVKNPRFIRYAWQPYTRANIINTYNLPASTFKTTIENNDMTIEEGIESGVSGAFIGTLNNKIITAGGCNFPVNPMAPDSKKKFYEGIYELTVSDDDGSIGIKRIGTLPEALAYGASISASDAIYIIGGNNSKESKNTVYKLSLSDNGTPVVDSICPLPVKMDNFAAAICNDCIYLAGGNLNGIASNELYRYNLKKNDDKWIKLASFPGNSRVQPVLAASTDGKGNECLYLWGGFCGKTENREATLNTDGYRYDIKKNKWQHLPAPTDEQGNDISVGGGACCRISDGRIVVVGGVNKDIFLEALRNQAPDYLSHPSEWYRFNDKVLVYNPLKEEWTVALQSDEFARAGASLTAICGNSIILYGGEIKPRIRTSETINVIIE